MSVMEDTRPTTPTGSMSVMDTTGHTRVSWNRSIPVEVEMARLAYNSAIQKGYQAFATRSDGAPGRRLDSFDPAAEEIVMVPKLQGG